MFQILFQAEDRVHRIGQRRPVVIHYLVARQTCDDTMWPMIQKKIDVLGTMGVGSGQLNAQNESFKSGEEEEGRQRGITEFFGGPSSKRQKLA